MRTSQGPNGLCARLRRDRRGSAIIQFAMVAAPFIALLIASLETALVFFTQESLETAAEAAARTITTGQAQGGALTQASFKQSACDDLPSYLNCANLYVDVQKAPTFGAVDTTAPVITYDKDGNVSNNFAYDTGGAGDIVVLRLMYLWPVSTGPLGLDFSNAGPGKRLLVSTSVAKTEPYA